MNCMTRIGTNSDRTECGVVFPHVCVIFRYILFCVRPVLQSVYERIGRTQLVLLCLHPRKAFPIGVGKVHKRRAVRFEIGLIFNSPVTREIRNYSFIVLVVFGKKTCLLFVGGVHQSDSRAGSRFCLFSPGASWFAALWFFLNVAIDVESLFGL